jgi:hypothetical protein
MEVNWLQQAVANNAEWCRIIARCHGLSSYESQHAWYCREEMPPFYPNLVTLNKAPEIPNEVAVLESALPSGWGLKDSFAALDLAPYRFHVLSTAEWYVRQPAEWPQPPTTAGAVRTAETEKDLSAWMDAWAETPPGSSIFTSQLLEEDLVKFLYIEQEGTPVAGLAMNLSDQVVGISNAFGHPRDVFACIRHCAQTHSSKGIVGYGGGAELRGLARSGFKSLGRLRIWVKD